MSEENDLQQSHVIDFISKKKDNDRIAQVQDYNLDIEANHVYLFGEESYIGEDLGPEGEPGVEFSMANRFIKNLNILMRKSNNPILIHMKTCGGDWNEGMAIYDAIRACPNPTTILNYTHARSMSSIIFQAANKRVMMPNSHFLIHDGTLAYSGTQKQTISFVEWYKRTEPIMLGIYADSMEREGKFKGNPRKAILDFLRVKMDAKEDVYWTAKQTVTLGLADEIFGHDGKYDWSKLLKYTKEELTR